MRSLLIIFSLFVIILGVFSAPPQFMLNGFGRPNGHGNKELDGFTGQPPQFTGNPPTFPSKLPDDVTYESNFNGNRFGPPPDRRN